MWDPAQYQRFADERSRPFFDLLARVRAEDPPHVVDLGCGPGTLTASLSERWPAASIEGVDSSDAMIEQARVYEVPGRVSFTVADIRSWRPVRPVGVLVSNATLQWVPEHVELLPELVGAVAPGGWLAFQVPGNHDAPSHTILAELVRSQRWRHRLAGVGERGRPVAEPEDYLRLLAGLGCTVDAWETTYLHVLPGDDPVLEWVKGTALRPVLAALDETERVEFLAEYGPRLRAAYPSQGFGTVLPFRRIFVVARKRR